MFVGTILLQSTLLPSVVLGCGRGGNGKINGVQWKLPRASQLFNLLITDMSFRNTGSCIFPNNPGRAAQNRTIHTASYSETGVALWIQTRLKGMHSGDQHGRAAPALHKWGHKWGHKRGQSHPAPYDPTETPGMKAVQQAIRLRASRHQPQTSRVIIPFWHLTASYAYQQVNL